MKNKFTKTMLTLSRKVLTGFALKTSASACNLATYQPAEPKSLREK